MKKIIVALFALLILLVPVSAGGVAYANDAMLLPPTNLGVIEGDDGYCLTFENVPGNNGYEIVIDGVSTYAEKDENVVKLSVIAGTEFVVKIRTLSSDASFSSEFFETTLVVGKRLPAPENVVVSKDKVLAFDKVDGAVSYDVVINGVNVERGMTENTLDLSDVLTSPTTYEINVRANGDNRLTYDGKYSTIVYENELSLGNVENVVVSVENGKTILSFDKVLYASGYEIDVNGAIAQTTDNMFDLTDKVSVPSEYTIKVRAKGGSVFSDGEWTSITYSVKKSIEKPTLSISGYVVSWDKSEGANEYSVVVTLGTVEVGKVERFSGTSFDISSIVSENGVGEYVVEVQALSNGNYDYSDVATIRYRECGKLDAPTLVVEGTVAKWTGVDNANEYTLKIDGRIVSSTISALEFDFSEYVAEVKTYTISVSANANGWYRASDETSAEYVKEGTLSAPTLFVNDATVGWFKVLGATEYDVYVGNVKVTTVSELSVDLSPYLNDGENVVKVVAKAQGYKDGSAEIVVEYFNDSDDSAIKTYGLMVNNESDYIVFADGERTDYKIVSGRLALPSTVERIIIVPDVESLLLKEDAEVNFYSEIMLSSATEQDGVYMLNMVLPVETRYVSEEFEIEYSDVSGLGTGVTADGATYYYLCEKGKYRPVDKSGE